LDARPTHTAAARLEPNHQPHSSWDRRRGSAINTIQASVAARPATTATKSASTATATATATSTGALAILRLIDFERAAIEVGTIQRLNGNRGIGLRHLHEAKAARTTCLTIGNQRDLLDSPVIGKKGTHRFIGRGEGKVANE